jgi:hypothetical protein
VAACTFHVRLSPTSETVGLIPRELGGSISLMSTWKWYANWLIFVEADNRLSRGLELSASEARGFVSHILWQLAQEDKRTQ